MNVFLCIYETMHINTLSIMKVSLVCVLVMIQVYVCTFCVNSIVSLHNTYVLVIIQDDVTKYLEKTTCRDDLFG